MKRIRRTTAIHRSARQLDLIHTLAHQIAERDVDSVLGWLAEQLHSALGYPAVAIALLDGDRLVLHSSAGPCGVPAALDCSGLASWVARHAELALVDDSAADPRCGSDRPQHVRAQLAAPIGAPGALLGVIELQSGQAGAFHPSDARLLTSVAQQIALMIANARLAAAELERRRELEQLQHTEQLLVSDMEQSYNELLITLTELERRDEQLRRSERLNVLGELASGVAHDFNNLLAGIIGNTELLLLDETDPERRRDLAVIEQSAQDGAAIVRRIQEFARQTERRHDDLVQLADVIEGALAITRPRWHTLPRREGRPIALLRESAEVPLVLGSAAELRELLINLILNAVDAMPQGGDLCVRLRFQAAHAIGANDQAPGINMAIIEVADSGVGISPEQQERVFEFFYSTKAAGQGSGLGLAMCRQIVARHGGGIELESAPGQGATFRVLLPVAEAPAAHAEAPAPAPVGAALRILVVDNDAVVRDVLTRLLERAGHHVAAAGSAEQALGLFAPRAYDLLFTDLSLPDLDGATLLGHLRAADPQLLAVVVSGWGQAEVSSQTIPGAAAVVAKPFNIVQIKQVLADLTGRDAV